MLLLAALAIGFISGLIAGALGSYRVLVWLLLYDFDRFHRRPPPAEKKEN